MIYNDGKQYILNGQEHLIEGFYTDNHEIFIEFTQLQRKPNIFIQASVNTK